MAYLDGAMKSRHTASVALAAVACALALAACGSSRKPRTGAAGARADFVSYSKCMRSHGVPRFPDPSAGGGIHITAGSGVSPFSPAFQSAQQSCKKELPGGGPPPVTAGDVAAKIGTSRCMRAHGVPDFPDPTGTPPSSPTANVISINGVFFVLGPGISPASPSYEHAAAACGLGGP